MNKLSAETRASIPVASGQVNNAISASFSFAQIEKLVDLSVPPRRPTKTQPDPIDDEEAIADFKYRTMANSILLSNDDLKRLAEKHPAPQEWYEEKGKDE